jgi:hypothetical protein
MRHATRFSLYILQSSYALVHTTDVLLTVTFPFLPVSLEHFPSALPPTIPSRLIPTLRLISLRLISSYSSCIRRQSQNRNSVRDAPSEPRVRGHDHHRLHSARSPRSCADLRATPASRNRVASLVLLVLAQLMMRGFVAAFFLLTRAAQGMYLRSTLVQLCTVTLLWTVWMLVYLRCCVLKDGWVCV